MALNIDTDADYVLEAYWWSHRVVDNVVEKHKKIVLACIIVYRDYENELGENMQLHEMITLRDKLVEAYRHHPDGEVIVELTIKQEFVNG
jgi:hypothetical protein